jgi:hypothetical protein
MYVRSVARLVQQQKQGKEEEDMKTLTIYPPFFYITLL